MQYLRYVKPEHPVFPLRRLASAFRTHAVASACHSSSTAGRTVVRLKGGDPAPSEEDGREIVATLRCRLLPPKTEAEKAADAEREAAEREAAGNAEENTGEGEGGGDGDEGGAEDDEEATDA